ncbi:MAG: 2-succinyl-5-enolpyruvyl-6-hydroxy-3-cyclohexene-1-carboxylic-acid synthase [Cryomorphaceae bacterium]
MAETKHLVMSDKKGVHALVTGAHAFGVRDVIICPGSRNAPFTISFSRSGLFRCHSIADERVAGFYALGMALATKRPVLVVCTSGSAGINLGPALAEAFYLKAPVVAVTADRPTAWVDQGNGQTIRQEGLFSNYIRGEYNVIGEPLSTDETWMNRRKISELFNSIICGVPGPIHFNVPLSEPLYNTESYPLESMPAFYRRAPLSEKADDTVVAECAEVFASAKRVMVLIGQMPKDAALNEVARRLAAMPHVTVLTETTANISAEGPITTIDRLIMSIKDHHLLESLMPDLLITAGGMIVSKRIKALLREFAPAHHWHINPHDEGLDTFRGLTLEIPADPANFLGRMVASFEKMPESNYASLWERVKNPAHAAHLTYIASMPWSDFKAFDILLSSLEGPIVMHMANSSAVRYVQLFGTQTGVEYHANRGTSGIDGSTSTAAGWARANPEADVVLITGDTAFMYDSNALWNNSMPQNLKIIVINNEGGGIFRIIEGPAGTEELEPFFEAHHPASIRDIATAFGVNYLKAENGAELIESVRDFKAAKGCTILEVKTHARKNAGVLKKYFKFIAGELSAVDISHNQPQAK